MEIDNRSREILADIVRRYGAGICEDHRRLKGLLLDHCAQCRAEINLLLLAQQEHVPQALLRIQPATSGEHRARQLIHVLQETHYLTEEAACWAVESWALALDVPIQTTAFKARKAAAWHPAEAPSPDITLTPVEDLGIFLTPLSMRGYSVGTIYALSFLALIYILNPIPGGIDLIPDFIPVIGNLDDAAAAIMLWYGLVEFFEGRKLRAKFGGKTQ